MADQNSRIEKLEKELSDLKLKLNSDKPKKEKKPREPTEYNKFVKDHIEKLRKKHGDKYNHKEGFKSATEAWSSSKNSSKK